MSGFRTGATAAGLLLAFLAVSADAAPAVAAQRGSYTFYSADNCAASGKMPKDICANAARNASAEFEEKAPHFATRGACEAAYRAGGCAVSFRQSAPGARGGVSFTPRPQGFRVTVRSDNDISTMPVAPGLVFAARTAVRSAVAIDPRAAGAAAPRAAGPDAGAVFGSSNPDGPKLPAPPSAPYEPNFDCSKYVEPSNDKNAGPGCLPGPAMRR